MGFSFPLSPDLQEILVIVLEEGSGTGIPFLGVGWEGALEI